MQTSRVLAGVQAILIYTRLQQTTPRRRQKKIARRHVTRFSALPRGAQGTNFERSVENRTFAGINGILGILSKLDVTNDISGQSVNLQLAISTGRRAIRVETQELIASKGPQKLFWTKEVSTPEAILS